MNNLLQRTITGTLFAIVVLGSILWDAYAQAVVFSVFMVLGLLEFYNLFNKIETQFLAYEWYLY